MQPQPPAGQAPPHGNRMLRPPHPSRVRHPVWYALVTGAEHVEHEAAESARPLPSWLLPALEGGVLLGLAIANPVRIERRGVFVRWVSIVLILLISGANAASAVPLIHAILTGHARSTP